MLFIARELREIMAKLGIRTVEEMVGRSDLLKARKNVITDRAETVDLSRILNNPWLDQMCIRDSIKAITAITNPLVNSYKRLVPGYEAPCYCAWSANNRSALIRIPLVRGRTTRVELRSPDPSCNPYLALAVCLACLLYTSRCV